MMWVGLYMLSDPPEVCMSAAECDGVLKWGDGTPYSAESWSQTVQGDGALDCYRMTSDAGGVSDSACSDSYAYLCQVTCPQGIHVPTYIVLSAQQEDDDVNLSLLPLHFSSLHSSFRLREKGLLGQALLQALLLQQAGQRRRCRAMPGEGVRA